MCVECEVGGCGPDHMLLCQINYMPCVYVEDAPPRHTVQHSYCLLIPLINLIIGSLPVQSINPHDKLHGWRLHWLCPSPRPSTDLGFIDKGEHCDNL